MGPAQMDQCDHAALWWLVMQLTCNLIDGRRCCRYQQGKRSYGITQHTLIVERPEGGMTRMEIFAENPAEVFWIGHELFPGRRLAAVNHEDEDEGE
jgi:hypothetical protein